MTRSDEVTAAEQANRLSIRELADACARYVCWTETRRSHL